ncbi:hypothetical protein VP01_9938g1, partial [Puccinia sorghi]
PQRSQLIKARNYLNHHNVNFYYHNSENNLLNCLQFTCSMLQPSRHPNSTSWLNHFWSMVGVRTEACWDFLNVNCRHLRKFFFAVHLSQSQVRIENAIGILKGQFSSLRELRNQIRNFKEMKDTIKWIISCVVLHNLLADLKDQSNDLYQEDEPDSAPVAEENIDNSNNGICNYSFPF